MKIIGLIGGMSWESTAVYYKLINEEVKIRLGDLHSAKVVIYSVDFAEVEICQRTGNWQKAGKILNQAALKLQAAGVDVLALCTNTMHKIIDQVCIGLTIPLLHIVNPTINAITSNKYTKAGLLGTRYTMEESFYISDLQKYSIDVLTPHLEQRVGVHKIIYDELCKGIISKQSEAYLCKVVNDLKNIGADCIVLACTELNLLLTENNVTLPLFDTTYLHAQELVNFAI